MPAYPESNKRVVSIFESPPAVESSSVGEDMIAVTFNRGAFDSVLEVIVGLDSGEVEVLVDGVVAIPLITVPDYDSTFSYGLLELTEGSHEVLIRSKIAISSVSYLEVRILGA